MKLFDSGTGTPVVVVPGMAGRWEWMAPTLARMARRQRTVAYSLCGEPGSGWPFPPGAPFDAHVTQIDAVLDRVGARRAVICGVSLGGWIGLRYAARRPDRVTGLVLASSPGPGFRPDARQQRYLASPLLRAPLYALTARGRLGPEMRAAFPLVRDRWRFLPSYLARVALAPPSPMRMAARIRCALVEDFGADCAEVRGPVLVLTGEEGLDRVVPVASSREYVRHVPGARHTVVARTGHLGVVTRPAEWADAVTRFADECG